MITMEQQISEATGFDLGDLFESAEQVRAYFTPDEQRHMFGEDAITDPVPLGRWADAVIENRWHCAF